jgi:metal-responsive CopG/Arc/MetJ family transcriptional regulator
MRAHVVVPEELVREVDQLVGSRKRSQFFADAVREKLARVKLVEAARKAAGSLADVDIPGWESSEAAAAWVRASRQADEQRLRDAAGS